MTHLYQLGCEHPHKALTACDHVVSTMDIVAEKPTCTECRAIEVTRFAALEASECGSISEAA